MKLEPRHCAGPGLFKPGRSVTLRSFLISIPGREHRMDSPPAHLQSLMLLRLLAAGAPPDRREIARCLAPYFLSRLKLSAADWRFFVAESVENLNRQKLFDVKTHCLTQAGRVRLKRFLNVKQLPNDATWRQLRNRQLMAKVLEVSPRSADEWSRLASADGLRAAIVARFFDLPVPPLPTWTEALNALAVKQTGDASSSRLSPRVRDSILRESLLAGRAGNLKFQIPALAVQAQDETVETLRVAAINRWLDEEEALAQRKTDEKEPNCPQNDLLPDNSLHHFANQVRRLALESPTGRYGENKVYLSHIWKQYQASGDDRHLNRAQFDQQLLAANRQNLLTLSRADLTIGMDPKDVEESEIRTAYSTFHFLKTD